jgi:adhesin/invasin
MPDRFRTPRMVLAGLVALAGGACSDSTGDSNTPVQLALQPELPASYPADAFDLAVDRVRVRLIRPPAEAVIDTVVMFPPNATELSVKVKVPLIARREVLNAGIEMSAGTRILFAGTREVEVSDVPGVAPSIPLQYVGPGTMMTSIRIEPRDSALRPGQVFRYRVVAFSGQTELEDFYVGWSTNDPEHVTVDALGSLVVPAERGSFILRVVSPTGVKDSTRVWISLPATGMTYIGGDDQASAVGTQLPGLLVVRAVASDGSGVPGVPVRFIALSGGTVREPVILTDADGYARNTVILGPIAGLQLFEATTAGLPTITFRSTAKAGPPFRVTAIAGNNQQGIVGQVLPDALIARVSDAAGNFIAGVPVTWQVVTGGGVLEQVDTQTNLNGLALGIFRLGTLPTTNSVRVSASGGILFADFGATAVAGPPANIEAVAGDGQTGLPGASLAPFTVLVTDEFGNALPGIAVQWTVEDGGGTLSTATTSTDINGRASVSYQLPVQPGIARVRAAAGPVSTVFTATAAEPPTESSMRSPRPDPRPARSGESRRAD